MFSGLDPSAAANFIEMLINLQFYVQYLRGILNLLQQSALNDESNALFFN